MYFLIVAINKIIKGEIIEDKGDWLKIKEDKFDYSRRLDKFTPLNKEDIKKQSENLYDLIEVGDLVKHLYDLNTNKYIITQIMEKEKGMLKVDEIFYIDVNDIKAIYKPNSKGDYIKAWESE